MWCHRSKRGRKKKGQTLLYNGTPTIFLAYNRAGRQVEALDAAGVTTFLYDELGAVTNETVVGVAGTNTIERFYDSFGRSLGYSLNGIRQSTLAYDPVTGRLLTLQIPSEQSNNPNNQTIKQFTWTYLDGSDLKSSLTYPNGLYASWAYDAKGQLLQVCNAFPTNVISQYDYTYDAAGRRVACGKSGSAFAQNDTIAYTYNNRSELTNAVASVDSDYRYSYAFDEIGNRETSSERGTNSVYAANNLNQYTAITDVAEYPPSEASAEGGSMRGAPTPSQTFTPLFDDDGNQTLIQTATGIWQVQYNGENRPILWTCTQSNNQTITNNQTISMTFDRMGRRVTKNDQRFVYNGYLQIANFEHQTSNIKLQTFIWDPTEPVATRPLVWITSAINHQSPTTSFYAHDGNKNVSEVLASDGALAAHYDYAPFGETCSSLNSLQSSFSAWRFSSEYADDDLGLVYYNFRHFNPMAGRWLSRDPIEEAGGLGLYAWCSNLGYHYDVLGQGFFDVFMDVANVVAGYFTVAAGAALCTSWIGCAIGVPMIALGVNSFLYGVYNLSSRLMGNEPAENSVIEWAYKGIVRSYTGKDGSDIERRLDYVYFGANLASACISGTMAIKAAAGAIRATAAIPKWGVVDGYVRYWYYCEISARITVTEATGVVVTESFKESWDIIVIINSALEMNDNGGIGLTQDALPPLPDGLQRDTGPSLILPPMYLDD